MYRGNTGPRIFPIIIVIVVIALIIAAIVSAARMIFFSGGNSQKEEVAQTVNLRDEVLKTYDGRAVRYTVRGPIVADESFRSYQITVTPTSRTMTTYRGYLDEPLETKTFSNNTPAYEQFVYALDKADISQVRSGGEKQDIRGVCANNGRAYTFEVLNQSTQVSSLWTSTCKGSKGTMAANVAQIHQLFSTQIPEFTPVFDKVQ